MASINPEFGKGLIKYGAYDFNACYNCGTCTAVCSLSTEEDSFPREMVRLSALGDNEGIKASLKPWLCYYCGECSSNCPRQAHPGELMMSLRRWLTSAYDWTGLSGLLYKSIALSVAALVFTAASVIAFAVHEQFNLQALMHTGHQFETVAIAAVFTMILLPNLIRIWWFTVGKTGTKVPFSAYFKSMGELFVHMFTQKRALGCDNNQLRWFEHFILVIAYLTLLFTTIFLNWFATANTAVIVLGYIVSAVIFIVTIHFGISRLKKEKEINKNSQPSDWMFLIWMILLGITAFFVRLFIDLKILEQYSWVYLLHLVILVQWALIIVPFGKWTHFLYRSFAMYLVKVKKS